MKNIEVKEYLERFEQSDFFVNIRLCEVSDAQFVCDARQNVSRNEHLSTTKGDLAEQVSWLESYKERESKGEELYFVIEEGNAVGLFRMYDYVGDKFSWGSWLILPGAHPYTAYVSALVSYEIGFGVLGFEGAYFDVRLGNKSVWKFHERCGAKLVKEEGGDRYYEFSKADYLVLREKWKKFLPFKLEVSL